MEPLAVCSTTDRPTALAEAGGFLRARPVENNLVLTLLQQRPHPAAGGRYWWARRGGKVVGFVFLSPRSFRAVLSPADPSDIGPLDALVERIADEAPDLSGVSSDAATASAFAGRWADRRRVPVSPTEMQRIYRLGTLVHPIDVAGRLRKADASDRDAAVAWTARFLEDTASASFDPAEMTDRHLRAGRMWVWDRDGCPVSMAAAAVPVAGVARVSGVYTPPEQRSRGYASASVAALSAWLLALEADTCILYAQLSNPTSNAIYRRIGYEPVTEVLMYRFG